MDRLKQAAAESLDAILAQMAKMDQKEAEVMTKLASVNLSPQTEALRLEIDHKLHATKDSGDDKGFADAVMEGLGSFYRHAMQMEAECNGLAGLCEMLLKPKSNVAQTEAQTKLILHQIRCMLLLIQRNRDAKNKGN